MFAALFAVAAARPSVVATSPVVYSSHYVQPVVRAHYAVPVVKTLVHTPVVHTVASPVVHSVVSPVVHAAPLYHSVPVVKTYAPAYGFLKKH